MKRGIDISHHNTITTLKGYDFVIIRAGYGSKGTDRKFKDHVKMAIDENIPFGLYWFLYAITVDEAIQNASRCIEVCSEYKDKMSLPLYSDYEYDSEKNASGAISAQTRTNIVNMFNDAIQAAGFRFGTYANLDYLKNKFSSTLRIGSLWYAQWNEDYNHRYKPDIWQFTNRLNGEDLDGNYLINENLLNGKETEPEPSFICPVCKSRLQIVKA